MTYLIASLLKSRISNFKSIINVGPTGPYLFIVMGYFPHSYSHAHDLFVEPWSDFSLDPPLLLCTCACRAWSLNVFQFVVALLKNFPTSSNSLKNAMTSYHRLVVFNIKIEWYKLSKPKPQNTKPNFAVKEISNNKLVQIQFSPFSPPA